MRRVFVTIVTLLLVASCAGPEQLPAPPADAETPEAAAAPQAEPSPEPALSPALSPEAIPEIDTFTGDALFAAGGGGCGMSLWAPETDLRTDGNLFFHGLEDEPAFMSLDGQLTRLQRTAASGADFYGQQTAQTFATADGQVTVQVEVTVGEPGEIESVNIPAATITVEADDQLQTIPAVGDAGC